MVKTRFTYNKRVEVKANLLMQDLQSKTIGTLNMLYTVKQPVWVEP